MYLSHDYEALDKILRAFKESHIRVLKDEQDLVEIKRWTHLRGYKSQIQLVGSIYNFGGSIVSRNHIQNLCGECPRI